MPSSLDELAQFIGIDLLNLPQDFTTPIESFAIGDHKADIIVSSASSKGMYCCIAMTHKKDFGPPLHLHQNEDEYFLIVKGNYLFQVQDHQIELTPGNLLRIPKGQPHAFRCLSEVGNTLVFTSPAGFEDYFAQVASLAQDDFKERLLELNSRFGIEFVGPPISARGKFWNHSQ